MAEYTFVVETTISMHIDVNADSLEEAIDKAKDAGVMSLCWQCSRSTKGEWSTSGELDCQPQEAPLVDAYIDGDGSEETLEKAKEQW